MANIFITNRQAHFDIVLDVDFPVKVTEGVKGVLSVCVFSGPKSRMHADTHAVPIGFSTGEKTITVFSDANRNSVKDPGEVSVTKTFTVPYYPNL